VPSVVALAGGVGGAKLAHGLAAILAPGDLTVVVNSGDDEEFHGLLVCPDHDTVLYTLAGLADRERGWGLAGETWAAAAVLEQLGEPAWFRLGDRDLALHVHRTRRLREGARLTDVNLGIQRALGVATPILPMADEAVRTRVRTPDGWLAFQEYFVRLHQAPDILEVAFAGIELARPTAEVVAAFASAEAIVICPSNPFVSIGPILVVPGMRALIDAARERGVRVVAVSPLVGGRALKGPADRMARSLGAESSATGIARLYAGLIDALLVDVVDATEAPAIAALGIEPVVVPSVMTDDASRAALAAAAVAAAARGAAGASGAGAATVAPGSRGASSATSGEATRERPVSGSSPAPRSQPALQRIMVLIPVRGLEDAKARLGEALDAEERRALVERLLARTVAAAAATPFVAEVVVISADPEVLALASSLGARGLAQEAGGLNEGLAAGRAAATAAGADAVLVVPADLPAVAAAELGRIVERARAHAGSPPVAEAPAARLAGGFVALVTDRAGRGTNVLLLAPPDAISFCFGEGSRAAHAAAARAAGAAYLEITGPLDLDLDTPDDLLAAEAAGLGGMRAELA
jgi:LPPG:FO 2-phospho-L-lactate transferase